jgi:Trm5-related predicted tRNA methylase
MYAATPLGTSLLMRFSSLAKHCKTQPCSNRSNRSSERKNKQLPRSNPLPHLIVQLNTQAKQTSKVDSKIHIGS